MTVASRAPAPAAPRLPAPVPARGCAARLVGRAPAGVRPYLELLRLDRPVGAWLLVVPGWIALAAIAGPRDGGLLGLLLLVYGVLSRGAACGLNDVLDAGFDAQVPRTAGRPVASGRLAARRALVLCVAVGAIAPLVMGFWGVRAVLWAAAGAPLAAVYPYMKRITHWPHVWLGITMNWSVPLVYGLLTGGLGLGGGVLYGALICWAVGTDVIYACQDREADVRAGVRSAAVLLGRHSRVLVGGVYAGCVVLLVWFGALAGLGPLYWPGLCVVAGQLGWQVWRADPMDVGACGRAFGTNPLCGLLILVAVLAGRVGTLG
ncbi:4-hydroxybenzoate octaprenyltransferase [Streptomyces sp. NPDC057697]|uniref:4-hydroxybenzoate octaprenyltransferase n=1 Tax=Streptomyces sp. NPDC057697 TaxID=3346219 RepID=UPI0036A9FF87